MFCQSAITNPFLLRYQLRLLSQTTTYLIYKSDSSVIYIFFALSLHFRRGFGVLRAVLLAHPVLKVTIVLVIVEISYHLEGPRFDLLLLDNLLKHVSCEKLLDAFRTTLELQRHHHASQLSPGLLYVASEEPRELSCT